MNIQLNKHDIDMIIDSLEETKSRMFHDNEKGLGEDIMGYQPHTISDVEDMIWYLNGFYND